MTLTQADIDQSRISENNYSHSIGSLKINYTDGVYLVATESKAFWLLNVILSYQIYPVLNSHELKRFQLWELTVNEDKSALVTCRKSENSSIIFSQKFEKTDFPLPLLQLYLIDGTLMLPSEN
ncbi:hypothetical protein Cri9333_0421 [Crinalium epipsammum PCC 9333]|uniref:DUF6876 domain-containing protein n=1 Tax=Crinalium epipsammum PCC 9333 TaxID=1173022 RepID=K9VV68_9CYAN|nr:DUF6876 family protein [Crinalium epipsammum]AFZ11392.1 hypothetical protein Cri9333_0421 [Crinalium epipsammum PCC 9333]